MFIFCPASNALTSFFLSAAGGVIGVCLSDGTVACEVPLASRAVQKPELVIWRSLCVAQDIFVALAAVKVSDFLDCSFAAEL